MSRDIRINSHITAARRLCFGCFDQNDAQWRRKYHTWKSLKFNCVIAIAEIFSFILFVFINFFINKIVVTFRRPVARYMILGNQSHARSMNFIHAACSDRSPCNAIILPWLSRIEHARSSYITWATLFSKAYIQTAASIEACTAYCVSKSQQSDALWAHAHIICRIINWNQSII